MPPLSSDLKEVFFLVTCEHGGNRIPPAYRHFFEGREEELQSHWGFDPGALSLARAMAKALDAPVVASTTSRLLVELNRSLGHQQLFSAALRKAPKSVKDDILKRHYHPYRERVREMVAGAVGQGRRIVHISSHSFTPVLDGKARDADIGLLFDPGRPGETAFCNAWQDILEALAPQFKVRHNYPYEGKSDGLCTWFRQIFPADVYVGIELEINQKHFLVRGASWKRIRESMVISLADLRNTLLLETASKHAEKK